MADIDGLFKEGWRIAEHVGMTEEDPSRRYDKKADKKDFIQTLLGYIYFLNEKTSPLERVVHPKINQEVVDYYERASNFGI